MPRLSPHILCFAPYTDWSLHSARQVTILQGLRQRGCSVTYVTCDGVFTDCDLLQPSTGAPAHKPKNACLFCQARVASRLASWGMPFRWLNSWLTSADRMTASKWIATLKPDQYTTAAYNDWPIGDWVKSSVHRHFRHNVLDLNDFATLNAYGSYLFSGLLAALALDRIFEEEKPDAQLLFNGRMAPTRIALELAKRRGVRTICEERAIVPGRIQLYDNENCLSVSDVAHLWDQWKSVPLAASEIDELGKVLEERWQGKSVDVTMFSSGMGAGGDVWTALAFDHNKPLYVLYTSSIDEAAGLDTSGDTFASQYEWIDATVDYAANHPHIQLAIRAHPNSGSKKSLGHNPQDATYFEALVQRLPPNVRMLTGDNDISSYDLAKAATVGLIWFSMMGVEMSALGRPVVRVAGRTFVEHADYIQAPATPADYLKILDRYQTSRQGIDAEIAVQAWRSAYVYFFRRTFDFPLVKQPNWFVGEIAYSSTEDLQPGRDATLDHIARVFMEAEPLHGPALAAHGDPNAEKDAILARITAYSA